MKHIDIGTIHAFLDGELSGDALEYAASHFSICDACSNLMLEAESDTDAVMQAFAIENSYAVPTQRIWARINNEIDLLESIPSATPQPASVWQNLAALFGFGRFSPFGAPAAGVALGVALVCVFTLYSFQNGNAVTDSNQIADNRTPVTMVQVGQPKVDSPENIARTESPAPVGNVTPQRSGGFRVEKANYRVAEKTNFVAPKRSPKPQPKSDLSAPLVEERLYLDAINDLSQTVASTDKDAMRPSFRVEYEQNVAMIDNAIEKMQKQVRRNPNDENAKRILFASYQNKIDLLNTVAEKSQLMATLR